MFKEFKKFILRGNVVDLAVGVAIGSAFTGVVNALVKDMITPLAGTFYGGDKFADAKFSFRGQDFLYGDVINTVITFVIVAAVVFFLVVQPINRLTAIANRGKEPEDSTKRKCPYCLGEIPKDATKCMYCTSGLKKAAD